MENQDNQIARLEKNPSKKNNENTENGNFLRKIW